MESSRTRLAGVSLLIFLSLSSSAFVLHGTQHIARGRIGEDEVTLYLKRFGPLRSALPTHATVGYESDQEDPLQDRPEVKRFYLTQYALAPVIVVAGVDQDLVVGNYQDPVHNCRICKSRDFILLNDLGSGLMLFRRVAR